LLGPAADPALPDVPTVSEFGYPGTRFHGNLLLLSPAALGRDMVSSLNRKVNAVLRESDGRSLFEAGGFDPASGSAQEDAALKKRESEQRGSS
jgi:tripartite-type tricarboxylate transporter receptor subunit TctC